MVDIDKIIAKHFTEELTPQEEAIFVQWQDKHKEEYAHLKTIMQHTEMKDHKDKFSIAEGWNSFEQEISNKHNSGLFSKSIIRFKVWRVAASILVLISVSIALLWNQNGTETMVASAITNVHLSDGSEVTLNKDASLYYPNKFGNDKRELALEGEAFFKVQPDKNRPFQINVNGTKVTVLGTSFNINSRGDSVVVVVNTGRVSFSTELGNAIILNVGEKGLFKDGRLLKTINRNVNFMAWKTKVIRFNDKPLSIIFADLEKIYGETILVNGNASGCYATIDFKNQTLMEALTELQLLFDFNMETENKIIEVDGFNCSEN